jgi:hypothetical protein
MRIGSLAAKFGFMILLAQGVAAEAAEVKVLSALADEPGDERARPSVRTRDGP